MRTINEMDPNGEQLRLGTLGFSDGQSDEGPNLDISEIFFMLSRHKWKILLLGLAGILSAVAVYFLHDARYQTSAKLLISYVLERNAIDAEIESTIQRDRSSSKVIEDELQILTSWDLAKDVAQSVGPERLIPPKKREKASGTATPVDAAHVVAGNLEAYNERNSNVITVNFKHSDPYLVVPVMNELISGYFDKHLEIHRSIGASEFIAEQTRRVKDRLEEIEDELNRLKREASGGVPGFGVEAARIGSTSEGKGQEKGTGTWNGPPESWAATRQQLLQAETERAAQMARIQAFRGILARSPEKGGRIEETLEKPDPEIVAEFEKLVERIKYLRLRNNSLREKFPPGNRLIQQYQGEIEELDSRRRELSLEYPMLAALDVDRRSGDEKRIDVDSELALLAATEARIKILQEKVREIEKAEDNLPDLLSKIRGLERLKAAEEEKYFYFASAVEKARIDEMLDPSKMPNIDIVQHASPPTRVMDSMIKKLLLVLSGGGFALGIGLALSLEMFVDRRIKRPVEFEKRLYMPLMISIPLLRPVRRKALPARSGSIEGESGPGTTVSDKIQSENVELLEATDEARFWPYAAAIRDRLFSYFQRNEWQDGPKLVAFTGFNEGAGTSTLAKAVTAMSTASGEKVLLIDMNAKWNEPHSIYEAEMSLRGAGNGKRNGVPEAALQRIKAGPVTPKNLYNLLPLIRQSNYGYVIFDMPPVDPTSPTNAMAGFMDLVLLIVDATKSNRDVVKQGYEELVKVNANVSCVYNKAMVASPGDRQDVVAKRRRQLLDGLVSRATSSRAS